MNPKWLFRVLMYGCLLVSCKDEKAQNIRGKLIALASGSGNVLQCSCSVGADGALHANNRKVNEEEAWYIWSVGNPDDHVIALQNFRNGYFMWRHSGGSTNHRARMIHDITGESKWTMISGDSYGLPNNYVAFKAYDGSYLKAWKGGGGANAPGEGGEVFVDQDPPSKNPTWVGWWRMGEVQGTPGPGNDIFTAVRDAFKEAFDPKKPAPVQGIPTTPLISCAALPPPVNTGTSKYIHAYCDGVRPSDFMGSYYSENEKYVARRLDCDIEEHHKVHPEHSVIRLVCDAGVVSSPGCIGVPR